MIRFSGMSRGKFVGVVLAGLVFMVGALTLVQQLGMLTSDVAKKVVGGGKATSAGESQPTSIDNANFSYLVPGANAAWTFDDKQTAFDAGKGLVKYVVSIKSPAVDVTFTEQQFPNQLAPRGSSRFEGFINDAKPTRSQDAGPGKVYFLPTLKNGAPANGSDTIVFATDDILMFGRSSAVMPYDAWATILATMTMKPVSK